LRKFWNTLSASLLLLVALGALCQVSQAQQSRITQAIEGGKVSPLQGTVSPRAKAEYDQGPMAASTPLQGMSISFKLSAAQQTSLDALLTAQQTPSSASYHQWLTPAQYANQFGMSQQDIDKVTEWLQSQGFTVDNVSESRTNIRFSGTVAQAEQAFHTQIHKYDVHGETHFANATAVSLPNAFAATVSRVGGLHDFKPKPRFVRSGASGTRGATPRVTAGSSSATPGLHFIAPGDFAVIYDVNPLYTAGFTGTNQTIGIAGQTDIVMADITSFRTTAGLPANNPTVFLIPGSADPGIGDASNDIVEADLDLETSGGVAKNANIIFINSTDVFDSLQYGIQNKINGVQIPILSVSYGNCEPNWASADIASLEASFQEANAQGQTVMAAAGDDGAADCDEASGNEAPIQEATQGLQVDYPGSSAYVTAMGGSEFTGDGTAANPDTGANKYWSGANGSADAITTALSYDPEMVWNDTTVSIMNGGGLDAGGGGKSLLFTKPSYQAGVPNIPADGARDVPDASFTASDFLDPYVICTQTLLASDPTQSNYVSSCNNGFRTSDPGFQDDQSFFTVGGTSAAAPSFAGSLALIEQKLGVPQGLGNVNVSLYKLASTPSTYASAFHDITVGNNIVPCEPGTPNCPTTGVAQMGYSAGAGYDQATGLGSLDVNNLATAFGTVATKGGTTTTIAVSPAAPVVGTKITLTATVASTSSSITVMPTGTVTFTIDGTAGTAIAVANGMAVTTTSFATGGTHTVSASYSGDTNFYVSTSAVTSIPVAATGGAQTTTTLVASPTTLALYGALSLNATVTSPAGGTVAGTVTFTLGTTTLGTANMTPGASGTGTATLSIPSITPTLGFIAGTNTITASYGGDSTYMASSGSTPITVTNPTITVAATAMTIPSAAPGNTGTSTITVTSGGGYTGTVNLTATVTTLVATGGFSNASVAVSPTSPGSTTLMLETTTATGGNERKTPGGNLRPMTATIAGGTAAGCILLLLIPGIRRRKWPLAMIMLVFLGVSAGLGCGSGGSGGGSPPGTYTVTITATDSSNSSITATTSLMVTIQ
jgi:Pro-kumamolisin, activation domain/Bacterial Ig-like domain (group 3)